jgi:single-strand DNA-binding protein
MTQAIHIIGRIGKDPVVREWNNSKVSNFLVATTDTFKDKSTGEKREETQWHKCVLWHHEKLIPFLLHGTLVYISGKMKYGGFEKDVSGEKVHIPTAEILVESLVLLSSPRAEIEPGS